MTDEMLRRVVLPVANVVDAERTARSGVRYLPSDCHVTALYVVEKGGGAPDKASVEQREEMAEEMFDVIVDRLAGSVDGVETRTSYGTDVVETVLEAAADADATAIAFTPRSESRWARLLTGDLGRELIDRTDRPVVALPSLGDDGSAPDGE